MKFDFQAFLKILYGIDLFKIMKSILFDTFTGLIGIPAWLNFALQSSRKYYLQERQRFQLYECHGAYLWT
jgi:hypothetical protein